MTLRVVFMGTAAFAVPQLEAICASGHEVVAVYTQPPRPAGRGQAPRRSPVLVAAQEAGLAVRTPASLRPPAETEALAALAPDLAVVAAYGLILPPAILAVPRLGCLNVHASLLPRWRGAAPIQRAILAGDEVTGISLMRMDAGLDTGDVYRMAEVPIGPDTTAGALHDRLAAFGAAMLPAMLADLEAGRVQATPQPDEGVTYAAKIDKDEARLDWGEPAAALERRIRAFEPWPGCHALLDGARLIVRAARAVAGAGEPGTVLDDHLTVACGEGALRLEQVQLPGRRPLGREAFLRGHPVAPGLRLG